MSPDLEAFTVSAADGALLLKLTPRRLQQLAAEGVIPKAARGRYPLAGLIQGYAGYLQDDQRRASKSAAASGLQTARQREIEMRMAKDEGELIPMVEALGVIDEYASAVTTSIKNLPVRFSRNMAERARIQPLVDETLRAVAKAMTKKAEELRTLRG
ncbi:hypothetical protein NS228_25185 [Methylobacterium indicum]|uniref:hypothetical protein n=2 Tax=Methylobacterium indicum TaxID=1775910 RepID=UPI000733F44B|nr:hypothetical protein [Methylobacterium indicum]KTS12886.1 hypothetical protein NS229_28980 [Methylobacterium indicum]KTS27267.1 hypothetical protein NS228_25185 [Methylobacterium indicum]